MADNLSTLADLIKINDQNLADVDVSDLLQDARVLAALAAETASNGTEHKYVKETAAPVVGFRAPNAGRDMSKSVDTLVTLALNILDASFAVDKAIADGYTKGGPEAWLNREGIRHLKRAFRAAEEQIINGTDVAGFTGLADILNTLANAMVLDFTTPAAAAALSSCYLLRTSTDGTECQTITGEDGNIDMGESTVVPWDDGTGKTFPAYYTPAFAWLGLQFGSIHSVGRIPNIVSDAAASGDTMNDALLSRALELFPEDRWPTIIAMNKRSLFQLQRSRTTTTPTGAEAPVPSSFMGITIVPTSTIGNAEAEIV